MATEVSDEQHAQQKIQYKILEQINPYLITNEFSEIVCCNYAACQYIGVETPQQAIDLTYDDQKRCLSSKLSPKLIHAAALLLL